MNTNLLTTDAFPGGKFFEDALNRLMNEPRTGRPWSPPVDIAETEHSLLLKADLPDVKAEDIDVRVENNTLTIKGSRAFGKDETIKGWHRLERSYGDFLRSFTLPNTLDSEKVAADFKNGVLTITVPKKESAKPRSVKVAVQN